MKPANYRSHLKNVRGLGAAHDGTHHFWIQRLSAVALIPLSLWFVINLATLLVGGDRTVVAQWFANPITALLMALFVTALFLHARLGIQTVIEDYMHCEVRKLVVLIFCNALNLTLCAASLFAIARLHFVGI